MIFFLKEHFYYAFQKKEKIQERNNSLLEFLGGILELRIRLKCGISRDPRRDVYTGFFIKRKSRFGPGQSFGSTLCIAK